jgi:hypothetical protein
MSERALYRIGSWAAIVGAIVALVTNLLHPRISEFGDYVGAELRVVRESDGWIAIHLGLLLGSLLIILGLFAFARSLKGGPAEGWARLALGSLLIAAPVTVMTLMVDGYTTKAIADATAPGSAGSAVAAVELGWALFMGLIITFLGFTPMLFGVAVAVDGRYPAGLGWGAALLGAVCVVDGVVGTVAGPSGAFFLVFTVASGLLTLWVLLLGVYLGRRARSEIAA